MKFAIKGILTKESFGKFLVLLPLLTRAAELGIFLKLGKKSDLPKFFLLHPFVPAMLVASWPT